MRKAQVSIFVILGIFLVVAIAILFFIFGSRGFEVITPGRNFEPESYLETCVRDSLRNKVDLIVPQGGFLNPADFKNYNQTKVAYLCDNINYYEPCVNQYPRYITSIQEELEKDINDEVQACFSSLDEELRNRGFTVSGGDFDISIVLKPEIIETTIIKDMTITQGQEVRNFESFNINLINPLYNLAVVAQEITTQEAEFCHFEEVGYSLLYNDFDIRKDLLSDSTKIYIIKHIPSGKIMNIAIRGCAIPPGF